MAAKTDAFAKAAGASRIGSDARESGVQEYAKKAKMPSSNIVRAVDPAHNPTQGTLTRLLRPLGLRLSVAPIRKVTIAA